MVKNKKIINKKTATKKTATKKTVSKKILLKNSNIKKKTTKKVIQKNTNKKKKTLKKVSPKQVVVKKKLTKKKLTKKKLTKKKQLLKNKSKNKISIKNKIKKNKRANLEIQKKPKKRLKKEINFDDHIKDIITKLLDKYKVEGIYTKKIIEKAIPKKFRNPENVDKVENFLRSNKITIVSEEEATALIKAAKEDKNRSEDETGEEEKKQTGKTDDPVRLYLRDMGSVELLSREGEIAIAKRIEAGREKMIGAICESPMTIRSIINWKESIKDGTMLLRDIVDLEATYDMSDVGDSKIDDTLKLIEGVAETKDNQKEEKKLSKNQDQDEDGENKNTEEDEDEDDGLNVSLAAMEEKLKPKVLKDFDDITKLFKKLQKHSHEVINADKKNESSYSALEKKYKKIQKEMVIAMKAVHFNSTTIEALMESLYELNKKLLVREGRMLRMSINEGVKRESFIEQYLNFNFEKNWIQTLLSLNDKNWVKFINKNHIEINKLIKEIKEIQEAAELSLSEFRRIVSTVQQGERSANRAKKEMIESNLRLVISIAKKIYK